MSPRHQHGATKIRALSTLILLLLGGPSCDTTGPGEPKILGLEPSRVELGQKIEATIHGEQFRTQLRVQVDSRQAPVVTRDFDVWLGANALSRDGVSYVDAETLRIIVPNTLSVGRYDLRVRTPLGQFANLGEALTVFQPNALAGGGRVGYGSGGDSVVDSRAGAMGTGAASGRGGMPATDPEPSGGSSGVNQTGANAAGVGGVGEDLGANGGMVLTSGGAGGVGGTDGSVGGVAVGGGGMSAGGADASAGGIIAALSNSDGGRASTTGSWPNGGSPAGASGIAGRSAAAGSAGVSGGQVRSHVALWTDGRLLRDVCGNQVVLRGVQQLLDNDLPPGNDWAGIIDQIAATGANAIRLQVNTTALGIKGVEAVLARVASHNMVAILNPTAKAWFADPAAKNMLSKYSSNLILDAYAPGYDDRAKFLTSAKAAVAQLRGYGYQVPFIVLTNQYGRDLPAALNYGAEIIGADPLHNTILGWDAYWGSSNWYQKLYGMTLAEGIAASAAAAFPIQLGLIQITDPPAETMDYDAAMTAAQANGLGWLWWDWYNPSDTSNNLSVDGTSTNLRRPVGARVVSTHPGGLARTATAPCNVP